MSTPWGSPPPDPDEPTYDYPAPPSPAYPGAAQPYPPPFPPQYPGGYPGAYPVRPPDHPQAVTAMVLGILGLVCCGLASPFAIWLGRKSTREIDASGGWFGGRGQAQAGFIMGIIGTVLWVLALAFYVIVIVLGMIAASTTPTY